MPKLIPEWVEVAIDPPGATIELLLERDAHAAEPPNEWVAELAQVAARLRAAKRQLEPPEGSDDAAARSYDERVRRALRASDMYADLKATVRSAGAQAPTNAWLKMYEMIDRLGLMDDAAHLGRAFRVFCNAELPGAFVAAAAHHAATRAPPRSIDWVACSLWPGVAAHAQGGVLGDTYGLAAANASRWLMGPEARGDLTSADDVVDMVRRAHARLGGPVDLYTSDAGIDVGGAFDDQERLTARIHLGQVVAGLMVLRVGGTMLVKTFTFSEPWSVAIIAACAACFADLRVVKPVTSRACNSEVYIVGRGFLGISESAAAALLEHLRRFEWERPMFRLGALDQTGPSVVGAARRIHGSLQVAFLEEVVRLAESGGAPDVRAARHAQAAWLASHPIPPLPACCRLPDRSAPTRKRRRY